MIILKQICVIVQEGKYFYLNRDIYNSI